MGRSAQLAAPELQWARTRFRDYYARETIAPPDRFARREFAAAPFASTALMRRHLAMRSVDDFEAFLQHEVPRHVYYSAAYYRTPDAPTMNAKDWLGADLIFDLDADHLRTASGRSYPEQLALVRERLIDLVDDFLVGDFGLNPEMTHLFFSGGRGYHVHVVDPAYLGLTSPERREIVDYVLGLGFDPMKAIRSSQETDRGAAAAEVTDLEGSEPDRRTSARRFQQLYPPDTPGWKGRLTRALLRLLNRWEREGPDRAVEDLVSFGLTRPRAQSLARMLVRQGYGRKIQDGLSLDVFRREVPPELLETVLRYAAIEVQGETDAPVTTDIHRLIRLPGSLHGGTGFRVVPLTRADLDRFDPFRHAGVDGSDGHKTRVKLVDNADYPFDPPVRGAEGQEVELTESAALFTILRGEARLPT